MRRKVIQIAGSTQLVSLPREWAKQHGIKKGEEVEVTEDGDRITISLGSRPSLVSAEIDITDLQPMIHRLITSYYRAGIDELKITYRNPHLIEEIHSSLGRETMVGLEILKQSSDFCIIRYVAGTLEEFDSVLRRIFLLLLNMSEESVRLLKEGNFSLIKNLQVLEKTNNKLTSICRRIINKTPALCTITNKVGPMYTVIEMLENLADEYKYICHHYSNLQNKTRLHPDALKVFEQTNSLLRLFYELFYKFEIEKLTEMKKTRDKVIKDAHKLFSAKLDGRDIWLVHHAIMLNTLIFNMVGPYLVTRV